MVTTIQVNERTLQILKKLKEETNSNTYDEAIVKVVTTRGKKESYAGYLKKHLSKKDAKKMLQEIQDERRKSDRF